MIYSPPEVGAMGAAVPRGHQKKFRRGSVLDTKMQIQYQLKKQKEQIGALSLEIECLKNLDETIDQVFKHLENEGNPQALEELCPYFGVIWPSARALAEYLTQLPLSLLQGKSVLELGCGLALPSVVAAKKGASVLATDFHPAVPLFLEKNIETNQVHGLSYQTINWEKERPELGGFDWVVGSDVLYERRYAKTLAHTLHSQVLPQGRVVITDPGRPYLQDFVDEMKKLGFQYETRITTVPHPPYQQDIFTLVFSRQVPGP